MRAGGKMSGKPPILIPALNWTARRYSLCARSVNWKAGRGEPPNGKYDQAHFGITRASNQRVSNQQGALLERFHPPEKSRLLALRSARVRWQRCVLHYR